MGHPEHQALLKSTELAFIPTFLLDLTAAVTFLIFQLHSNGPPEESLRDTETQSSLGEHTNRFYGV